MRRQRSKWIVYPKATARNPEQALDYLGRYTHRVAISDHRILAVKDDQVTFSWRDRADGNSEKTMTIPCVDFIGRFLLHVLPKGFQKVRAYGWLAQRRDYKGQTICCMPSEGITRDRPFVVYTAVMM